MENEEYIEALDPQLVKMVDDILKYQGSDLDVKSLFLKAKEMYDANADPYEVFIVMFNIIQESLKDDNKG